MSTVHGSRPDHLGHSVGHSIEKDINNVCSFRFGQVGGVLQCLDQLELDHKVGAPDFLSVWEWRVGIGDRIDLMGELCQEIDWLLVVLKLRTARSI